MSKMLVVGNLGYTERNIVQFMLEELTRRGVEYDRVGGPCKFFIPQNFGRQIDDWMAGIPADLSPYDTVLMLDYWNPSVPLMCYRMFTSGVRPRLVGLFHGSVYLEGDVAQPIPGAALLEAYLWRIFDRILLPAQWLTRYVPEADTHIGRVVGFPLDLPLRDGADTTEWPWAPRVLYASRWHMDKGCDWFVDFARIAAPEGIHCIATTTNPDPDDPAYDHIEFVGWQDQAGLRALAAQGGYVWAGARQETIAYAPLQQMAWGMSPLARNAPIYEVVSPPHTLQWNTFEEAVRIVLSRATYTIDDWRKLREKNEGNTPRMVDALLA